MKWSYFDSIPKVEQLQYDYHFLSTIINRPGMVLSALHGLAHLILLILLMLVPDYPNQSSAQNPSMAPQVPQE